MSESLAAISFYTGIAGLLFGSIRVARASLERGRSDRVGIASLGFGSLCFVIAVILFVSGPRGVLPF